MASSGFLVCLESIIPYSTSLSRTRLFSLFWPRRQQQSLGISYLESASREKKPLPAVSSLGCSHLVAFINIRFVPVLSLLGVILIARPRSLFGASAPSDHTPSAGEISRRLAEADSEEDGVTPAQRLIAVGYEY